MRFKPLLQVDTIKFKSSRNEHKTNWRMRMRQAQVENSNGSELKHDEGVWAALLLKNNERESILTI